MTQNLWDAAKAILRGKFIAIQSYLKKQETSQINNLTLHLKQIEKEEQKNPKVTRRKEINYREKNVKNTNTWRLNNMLLNKKEITEEIKEEIKKYLETNDNENTMIQNLRDAAKEVLRGKFIAI